jgi:hypothetical protein
LVVVENEFKQNCFASGGQGCGPYGGRDDRAPQPAGIPCSPLAEGFSRGRFGTTGEIPVVATPSPEPIPPLSAGLGHSVDPPIHHPEAEIPARQAKPPTREEDLDLGDAIAGMARAKSFAMWKAAG